MEPTPDLAPGALCESRCRKKVGGLSVTVRCGNPAEYEFDFAGARLKVCQFHRGVVMRQVMRTTPLHPPACFVLRVGEPGGDSRLSGETAAN